MASLKDTIAGLKAAGDVEDRLKAQVVALHAQLTEAQRAQVHCSRHVTDIAWNLESLRVPCPEIHVAYLISLHNPQVGSCKSEQEVSD